MATLVDHEQVGVLTRLGYLMGASKDSFCTMLGYLRPGF